MKLATKAAIGTASLVFLTSFLILSVTAGLVIRGLSGTAEARLAARIEREISVVTQILDRARQDVRTLALGPVVQSYTSGPRDAAAAGVLGRNLGSVLSLRDDYFQARYIDASGQEVARAEKVGGEAIVIEASDLQNKSERDYFRALRSLAPGTTLAFQVTLNREFGKLTYPLLPTVRLLAPVHDDAGTFLGGVVLNMDAERVFPPRHSGATEFRVVLPDGSYMLHPYRPWEYGTELGTAAGIEWELGLDPEARDFREIKTLHLERRGAEFLAAQGWFESSAHPGAARWRIIATEPEDIALAGVHATVGRMALTVLFVALLTSMIGVTAARWINRKVEAVSAAARRVADGDYDTRLPVDGDDELSETARAFNRMTEQIRDLMARDAEARSELSRLNAELLRSNGELENFARVTSHDLKSPLRPLTVLPDWIEEDMPDIPEPVREHLDEMRRQATRMTELVDGLLKYSLAGNGESAACLVDIRHLVETIVATLGTGDAFDFDVDLPPVQVFAVRTELDIVIRNLVHNAVKYHDRGSGRIAISVRALDGALMVSVTDDGPGIPAAYREKVLEPLVTLASRDEGGGSGLGLAIVAKIARRWNGRVDVQPNPDGRGTRVKVVLNIAAPAMVA